MSGRSSRFGQAFLSSVRANGDTPDTPNPTTPDPTTPTRPPGEDTLRRPPRGQGRHGAAPFEQLNVRLTPRLKRLATVRAAREGVTVGDLVERLLVEHLQAHGEIGPDDTE